MTSVGHVSLCLLCERADNWRVLDKSLSRPYDGQSKSRYIPSEPVYRRISSKNYARLDRFTVCDDCANWAVESPLENFDQVVESINTALKNEAELRRNQASNLQLELARLERECAGLGSRIATFVAPRRKRMTELRAAESKAYRAREQLQEVDQRRISLGEFASEVKRLRAERESAAQDRWANDQKLRDLARALSVALAELVPNRERLLVINKDYKRGSLIENYARKDWQQVIYSTFEKSCFRCKSSSDLTLDHLWMPKNEGGNFIMCLRVERILITNVLLLCRSCNASKGERPISSFFSVDQIEALRILQKQLSEKAMRDTDLCRVASDWYGVAIKAFPVGMPKVSDLD